MYSSRDSKTTTTMESTGASSASSSSASSRSPTATLESAPEEDRLAWIKVDGFWWPGLICGFSERVFRQYGHRMSREARDGLAFECLTYMKKNLRQPLIAKLDTTLVVVKEWKDFHQNLSHVLSQMGGITNEEMNWKWQRCMKIVYDKLGQSLRHSDEISEDSSCATDQMDSFDLSSVTMDNLLDFQDGEDDSHQGRNRYRSTTARARKPVATMKSTARRYPKKRPAAAAAASIPSRDSPLTDARSSGSSRHYRRDKDEGRYWGPAVRGVKKPRLAKYYNWENLWFQHLRPEGWSCQRAEQYYADNDGWFWVRPNACLKTGKVGRDFFVSKYAVQEWCRKHNYAEKMNRETSGYSSYEEEEQGEGWKQGPSTRVMEAYSVEGDDCVGMAKMQRSNKKKEVQEEDQDEELETEEEEEEEEEDSFVPSTPESPRTQPQDPSNSLPSESSIESPYTWWVLWEKLRRRGWTYKKGNGLVDFLYLRPGKSISSGIAGCDFFTSRDDVIAYIKRTKLEICTSDDDTERQPDSPRPVKPQGSQSFEESPKGVEWWRQVAIPDFVLHIWPSLQKIGFYYSGGLYRLPKTTVLPKGSPTAFPIDLDMQKYLAQIGVPNLENGVLTEEEAESIRRWIMFANVPVNSTNSLYRLPKLKILGAADAFKLLKKLHFRRAPKEGFVHEPTKRCFGCLEDVRAHVRTLPDLAAAQRRKREPSPFDLDEILALRLWAATSEAPLPKFENGKIRVWWST